MESSLEERSVDRLLGDLQGMVCNTFTGIYSLMDSHLMRHEFYTSSANFDYHAFMNGAYTLNDMLKTQIEVLEHKIGAAIDAYHKERVIQNI